MNKNKFIFFLKSFFIIIIFFVCSCNTKYITKEQRYKWLRIIFTGDINGKIFTRKSKKYNKQIGGLNLLTNAIQQLKKEADEDNRKYLLVDAGDMFNADVLSRQKKYEYVKQFIKFNKYDVMVPGNHEFDNGPETFLRNLPELKTKYVCANLKFFEETFSNSSVINNKKLILPFIIKKVNGIKIGITGIITEHLKELLALKHRKKVKGFYYKKIMRRTINTLKSKGVDIVIVLSHQGFDTQKPERSPDYKLAKDVKGIDLIISGHREQGTWSPYKHPETNTYICANFGQGNTIGKIDIMVDIIEGKIIRCNQILFPVDSKSFPKTTELIKYDNLDNLSDTFIINIIYSYLSNYESSAHRFCSEMLKRIYKADLAIINTGFVRGNIKNGLNYINSIDEIYPFENYPVVVNVPGKIIKNIIQKNYIKNNKYIFSGLKIIVSQKKDKQNIQLNNCIIKINNEILNENKSYRIVTTDYCLGKIISQKNILKTQIKSTKSISEVLKKYLVNKKIEVYFDKIIKVE